MMGLIHSFESSLQDTNYGFPMMAVVCLVEIKNTEMWQYTINTLCLLFKLCTGTE